MKQRLLNNIMMEMGVHLSNDKLLILKEVLVKNLQQVDVTAEQLPATMDDSNEYILALYKASKGAKLSEKTIRCYFYTLNRFLDCVHKPLTQVCEMDVEFFLAKMKKNNSEISLNNNLRNLAAFFAWMRKNRMITFNPCDNVDHYKPVKKPIDHLTAAELDKLKEGCMSTRDRAIIEVLRCTALRVNDVTELRINQIDFGTGKIMAINNKTRTYHLVMLDEIALRYVKLYLEERGQGPDSEEYLFTRIRGDKTIRMSTGAIRLVLRNTQKRSGLNHRIYPHLFRKTTATAIVARGGSVHDAGEYLGHKDMTVTGSHYAYRSDDYIANIFDKYVRAI